MTRRRQIITTPDGRTRLGDYMPALAPEVVSIPAPHIPLVHTPKVTPITGPIPTQSITGTLRGMMPQISVSKSLPLPSVGIPTDPRVISMMSRLADGIPTPASRAPAVLDRMKSIGTVIVNKPRADIAARQLLPNTTGERVVSNITDIASKVKNALASKLPSISLGDITALISKIKGPLLVTLGVAAVAALVYAGYSIYRRFNKVTETAAVPTVITPTTGAVLDEPIADTPFTVYTQDIADIISLWSREHNLTNARKVSLISQIKAIAEVTDNAAEFVAKVAAIEPK